MAFEYVMPEMQKISDHFDKQTEIRILDLENFLRHAPLEKIPAFALRGVKNNSIGSLSRAQTERMMQSSGYMSAAGMNYFIYDGKAYGANSRRKGIEPPASAEEFLTKLFGSSLSVKQYAGGSLFRPWKRGDKANGAIVFIFFDQNFSLPINGGNDGITGDFPSIVGGFNKNILLPNLEVGNIKRKDFPNGLPASHAKTVFHRRDLPPNMEALAEDSADVVYLKHLAASRIVYLKILEALLVHMSGQ